MCVVSMIGDHFNDKWQQNPQILPIIQNPDAASKKDLEELRKEVLEMKKLLERAVKYDKDNNEPSCEMEDKVAILKKVAAIVGVDLKDLI